MQSPIFPKGSTKLVKGHSGPIYTMKFSKSGQYCMTGSEDRSVCLFNPRKNVLVKTYKNIHNYEISSLDINKDNARFITGGADKIIMLTDVAEGKNISRFQGHSGKVNTVVYNQQNNVIISGSYDTTIRCWDNRLGAHSPIDIIKSFKDSVSHLIINKFQIIASSIDGYVKVFDIRKGQSTQDYFKQAVVKFALSNDTRMIAASCTNDSIYLLERSTGVKLKEYKGHRVKDFSIDLQFTLDDSHIVTGSQDGGLYFYNIVKTQFQKRLDAGDKAVSAMALHAGGGLATGNHEGNVFFWNY